MSGWVTAIIFLIPLHLPAQTISDIELVKHAVPSYNKPDFRPFSKNNNTEYQLFFTAAFLFYKYCFSSQDAPNTCSFTPSCSEYALLSIKKKGVFTGILNTFDRLSRCTLLEEERYAIDPNTGKLSDYP